jgi:uracil-DNA glycosylase
MMNTLPDKLEGRLAKVRRCVVCAESLGHEPRPVLAAHRESKIAIIGQAPGAVVHKTGVPWDDQSGENLRRWMGIDNSTFYDEKQIALIPMGFCYPGKGKSGDLPPRKECAPLWHQPLFERMGQLRLILLVGKYAQDYYLKDPPKTLTSTVRNFREYLPDHLVLPHPSPRNNIWQAKNSWFKTEVLPLLRDMTATILNG